MARYIRTVYTDTAGIRRKYETKKQWNTPDPDGINELLDLIRSLKAEGMTILVPSHQLLEISKVADHILILDRNDRDKKLCNTSCRTDRSGCL